MDKLGLQKGEIMFLFKKIPSISIKELERKLTENIVLIDVREPNEFRNGHILSAKNIPLNKIGNYKPKTEVYVICQSGMRSKAATKKLINAGYDAINVKGGMLAWNGIIKGGN